MRTHSIFLAFAAILITVPLTTAVAGPPSRAEVEAEMGLRSATDQVRGQLDTVGFVVREQQAHDVIEAAVELERASMETADEALENPGGLLGGVCPHDDHLYAARAYVHLTERITASRVILIGVFHKARLWDLEGRLVFDSFESWHGPWQPVPVSPLREQLIAGLAQESRVVDNSMHCREHSLEAIVPFLQSANRDVEIVPILVPYMDWQQIEALSDELAEVLAKTMIDNGWILGRDVAVVVSADLVHYGEDFDHAPFGSDAAAYERAVARDQTLLQKHLAGPIVSDSLRNLLYTLVHRTDVRQYQLPWCGRFSIPFGLELLRKTAAATGLPAPEGTVFRYATSLSEPELPVEIQTRRGGLGYTAPSNLHHWVGYAAVGYH